MEASIRPATISDFEEVHDMILEFATFQKTPEKMKITLDQIKQDAEIFKALIIRDASGPAIGFATYYFGYSSWSGKHLYLDDIYIKPSYRKFGIGHRIMDELETIGKETHCTKMKWLVSKWNQPAIKFYQKRGADIDDTEMTCETNLK